MGRKSTIGKGVLATRAAKEFFRYENIEDIAKHYGIYSFDELHNLIKSHSPIKDPSSFYMCDLIYLNQLHNPKASFHSICVDNLEALAMFIGHDPGKIFYGEAWFQNRKKKDKNIKRSDFPIHYVKMIDIISLRWKRLYVEKNKIFMGWHKEQTKGPKELKVKGLLYLSTLWSKLKKSKNKKSK